MAWVEVRRIAPLSAYVDDFAPCIECGGPTNTISFGFECRLHIHCSIKWWIDYWRWVTENALDETEDF